MSKKRAQLFRHWIIDGRIILWFNMGTSSFTLIGTVFVDELAEIRLVVLLWPLIGLQKHVHSIFTRSLRTAFLSFPARCRFAPCYSSP